ncbi:MAG: S-layer homology domain-containing protein [Acidimicrobiia bacterium]|nr:S-layer homology domain-containing protein [Acidimicrobiia bacterium]
MATASTPEWKKQLRRLLVLALVLVLVPVAVSAAGGPFTDDDNSVFEQDIEWLAAHGITQGCNPPTNDHFCPNDSVTRGQMAAFLHRFADDQGNTAYAIAESTTEIKGVDTYGTVMELTGLPEGSYHVIAKGQFESTELLTDARPTCRLIAGHEFDTVAATLEPGDTVPWTLTAVTYMAEDNSAMSLECRDHGEMVDLANTRITAVAVNGIVIDTGATL